MSAFFKKWKSFLSGQSVMRSIVVAVLVAIVIPYCVFSLLLFRYFHRFITDELFDSQRKILHETSFIVESILDLINFSTTYVYLNGTMKKDLSAIAESADEAEVFFAYANLRNDMLQIINSTLYTINAEMAIVDMRGKIITSTTMYQLFQPLEDFFWYQNVVDANGLPYWDQSIGELWADMEKRGGIGCARMLYSNSGDPIGMVAVYVPEREFWSKLKVVELDYLGDMFILDNARIIAADTDRVPVYLDGVREDLRQVMGGSLRETLEFRIDDENIGFLQPVGRSRFYLVNEVSARVMLQKINLWLQATLLGVLVLFAFFTLMAVLLARKISNPIVALTKTLREVEKGNLEKRAESTGFLEIKQLSDSYNQMIGTIEGLLESVKQEAALKEEAHFDALRAQINPHFLFNTLNSIKWMATLNADTKTSEMIADLGEILDNTLVRNDRMIPISQELDVLRSYINIQLVRYGSSLDYREEVPEEVKQYYIPKFILQPIIENAIIHGVADSPTGKILLSGNADMDDIVLTVTDNGAGVSSEVASRLLMDEKRDKTSKRMTGIGIKNVHERLRMQFGKDYGLTIRSEPAKGFSVSIRIPGIRREQMTEGGGGIAESSDC